MERALALDPSNGVAWAMLARRDWNNRDSVGGAIAARRGVQLTPNGWSAAVQLGICLGFVEMYDEAARWFEHALEVQPSGVFSLFALILFSTTNGDYPDARRWTVRARAGGADDR